MEAAGVVESIRRWWNLMGKERYPEATCLMITADGGGSNGSRVRLWKVELQKLADETGLVIMSVSAIGRLECQNAQLHFAYAKCPLPHLVMASR